MTNSVETVGASHLEPGVYLVSSSDGLWRTKLIKLNTPLAIAFIALLFSGCAAQVQQNRLCRAKIKQTKALLSELVRRAFAIAFDDG